MIKVKHQIDLLDSKMFFYEYFNEEDIRLIKEKEKKRKWFKFTTKTDR